MHFLNLGVKGLGAVLINPGTCRVIPIKILTHVLTHSMFNNHQSLRAQDP